MDKIPLQARLKREVFRKIAMTQDLIVRQVYSVFDKAVLHGGTGIWRCYSGKRFSEDLDFYLPKDKGKITLLFENLKQAGFTIKKEKVSESSVYSELELDRVFVRLEATFQNIPGVLCDYELSDGNLLTIYSLTPDAYLAEKIAAYIKRLKIRDLWDIFFLLKTANDIKPVGVLISNYKNPTDEPNLKQIVLEGIVPTSKEMLEYIKRKWESKNT